MSKSWFILILSIILESGCASSTPPAPPPVDPAAIQLAEAATSVSHSIDSLAEIEQAANPQAVIKPPQNPSNYGMGRLVSIDWSGPLEPLVNRLAHASDYRVNILGPRPISPILVTIFEQNVPMGDVLRDAALQANNHAEVLVFPTRRLVEVRYPTQSG